MAAQADSKIKILINGKAEYLIGDIPKLNFETDCKDKVPHTVEGEFIIEDKKFIRKLRKALKISVFDIILMKLLHLIQKIGERK